MTPNESDKDAGGEERNPEISPDSSPPEGETPFQRFEDFARRVISVPKSEIEERERAYQKRRENQEKKA